LQRRLGQVVFTESCVICAMQQRTNAH
jgi:hypothetical protein